MLPSGHRMTRSADFSDAVRGGRRVGSSRLVVHLRSADRACVDGVSDGRPTLVGFIVSRAVGGAVVRNRVKRRLRHLMRDRVGQLPAGSRVVVRALPAAASSTSGELAADLDRALVRAGAPRRNELVTL